MKARDRSVWRAKRVPGFGLVLASHLLLGYALLWTEARRPDDASSPGQPQRPAIQWLIPIQVAVASPPRSSDLVPARADKPKRRADAHRPIVPSIPVALAPPVEVEDEPSSSTSPSPSTSPSSSDEQPRQALDMAKLVRDLHLADEAADGDKKQRAWKGTASSSLETRLAAGIERAHDARAIGFGMAKVTEITSASDGTMRVYKITTPLGPYCAYYRRDGQRPSFGTCPR